MWRGDLAVNSETFLLTCSNRWGGGRGSVETDQDHADMITFDPGEDACFRPELPGLPRCYLCVAGTGGKCS